MTFNAWVAGSAGEIDSYNGDPYDYLSMYDKNVDRIRVMRDGRFEVMTLNADTKNCVFYFEQNNFVEDQLENIPQELDKAIMFEYGLRNFDSINVIGFSNGGNASARWIVRCAPYRPFTINNFISVSTPFNGAAHTGTPTGFLKEMEPFKNVFDNIAVHHFAGVLTNIGTASAKDGVIYQANAATSTYVTGQPTQFFNGYNHGTTLRAPEVLALFKTIM